MSAPEAREEDEDIPASLREHLSVTYEVGEQVGRGGMATVWRATRRADGADVAIKVLRPSLTSAIGSRRFLREISIASQTRSALLVPLEGTGEADGIPYYVMPFVEGGSLRQRLQRERQLSIAEACRIARDIARALATLHREGVVHRDIKPENILLRHGDEVLVADYGISRHVTPASGEPITSTGVVLGTPAYMSPEQASGEVPDARTDQYSWGCLFYEMLLGVPPFHGATSQAVIARHLHEPPPGLRLVRPSVPEAIERVITRALAKVPADRFPDFVSVLDALDQADRVLAPLPAPVSRRRRLVAGGIALALVVAVAAGTWRVMWPPLDSGRVVVYPLEAVDVAHLAEAARASILVRSALEDIEPSRWIDGAALIEGSGNGGPMTPSGARRAARRAGAQYYVTGSLVRRGAAEDSVRVAVTLHDIGERRDTTVIADGTVTAIPDVALTAVVGLLPRLTGLETQVQAASLRHQAPVVISNWLRGEREYRLSRMRTALVFLRRAADADTTLAPAALRGAMAAMWVNDNGTALQLVERARRVPGMLTQRQAAFAHALRFYLQGRADSSIVAVRRTLAIDDKWPEPWMLLGEVFLHLSPSIPLDSQLVRSVPPVLVWPLESWAVDAFARARTIDPGFTAPLAHLAQADARRGDVAALGQRHAALKASQADSVSLAVLALVQRCMTSPGRIPAWPVQAMPRIVFDAGQVLSGSTDPQASRCAEAALEALLASDRGPNDEDWGALVTLVGLRVARGAAPDALALVDSAVAGGLSAALGLYVVMQAAGVEIGERANAFVAQLIAALDSRPAPSLWLLALWGSHRQDMALLGRVQQRLQSRLGPEGTRLDSTMSRVADAYAALARRDTATAMAALTSLSPRAPTAVLQGSLWEGLVPERLLHATLLLHTGNAAAAHRLAASVDQPGIMIHPLFVRRSLQLRLEAARAYGNQALVTEAQQRLTTFRSQR